MTHSVACVVPCFNEEAAVGRVVADLRTALPDATIYVYDNGSTDRTVEEAQKAGALVRHEHQRGKGNVLRRAFADVDADALVIIDGDDTYDASRAREMVGALFEGPYDQIVGVRVLMSENAYRPGHAAGNKVLTGAVRKIFGTEVTDMLSGFRVFSRRFVKSFPALSREFETETEMTVHALNLRLATKEMPVGFKDRASDSVSKLRTYRDGWRIAKVILNLARRERPALVHSIAAALVAILALTLAAPVIADYVREGIVPRLPTAVLAATLMTVAAVILAVGYILEALKHMRQEQSRVAYLSLQAPGRLTLPTPTDSAHTTTPSARPVSPVGLDRHHLELDKKI